MAPVRRWEDYAARQGLIARAGAGLVRYVVDGVTRGTGKPGAATRRESTCTGTSKLAAVGERGPGTFDKVRALQIACPGLATGVHVNDEVGSATIARFPINTSPGGLIQFDPINPIRLTGQKLT